MVVSIAIAIYALGVAWAAAVTGPWASLIGVGVLLVHAQATFSGMDRCS